MKDYTKRPMVVRMLPWWQDFLKKEGHTETMKILRNGETKALGRKDRLGLIQALGLTKAPPVTARRRLQDRIRGALGSR